MIAVLDRALYDRDPPQSRNHQSVRRITGPWLYVVLFGIIFAETGLVVTPFLPGDSLLFAVGAVAAHPESPIRLDLIAMLLVIAAVLGDAVNYHRYFDRPTRLLPRGLLAAQQEAPAARPTNFYEEYGGMTIILARFIPIVRTFAPFVAGIGKMSYRRFALYNVTGGIAWILCFLLAAGGSAASEVVQKNFKLVILAIIVISVLPGVVEFVRVAARPKASNRDQYPTDRVNPAAGSTGLSTDLLLEGLLEIVEVYRIEASTQTGP